MKEPHHQLCYAAEVVYAEGIEPNNPPLIKQPLYIELRDPESGGRDRARTRNPLRHKQVLHRLSYNHRSAKVEHSKGLHPLRPCLQPGASSSLACCAQMLSVLEGAFPCGDRLPTASRRIPLCE